MMIPYFPPPSIPIGSHTLSVFSMTAAAAVATSLWAVLRRAYKLGVSVEEMFRLWFVMYIAAMVGAHLYKVVVDGYALFAEDPGMIFHYQGMSSAGAFGGGVGCGWMWCRHRRLSRLEMLRRADILAYVIPLGFMIGRLGCALAHDHRGLPSRSWIAVNFPTGPRFDLGLIEFLFLAGVVILFWILDRRPHAAGFYFGLFGVLYGSFRLLLNFARTEPEYVYGAAAVASGIATWVAMRRITSWHPGFGPPGSRPA